MFGGGRGFQVRSFKSRRVYGLKKRCLPYFQQRGGQNQSSRPPLLDLPPSNY